MNITALARPGKIGTMTLKNRIVVPSINNNYTHAAFMTQRSIDSYVEKAKGGAGLIITEATSVDYPRSRSVMNPAIDDDRYMPQLTEIAAGCHRYGAKVVVQLSHVGRQTRKSSSGMDPVAPSPIAGKSPLYPDPPIVLERADILEIIHKFGSAAQRAKRCGFDGVEVIMGHGYLANNFLSPLSNQRTDEYGGLRGGVRFCVQIVQEIKSVCGTDFPVICRLNGDDFVQRHGNTVIEAQLIAQMLERAGADAIHVSGGMRDSELNFNDHTAGTPHGAWLPMAAQIKRGLSIPVIAVKRITPEQAEAAVRDGAADFIAFGKQSIADPYFAEKILNDDLSHMVPCTSCCQGCYDKLWMWMPITCLQNPEIGKTREELEQHHRKHGDRRILVAGGGPAGCECAIELSKMGHSVLLAEQTDHLGGSYAYCAKTAHKQEIAAAIAYLELRLREAGVRVLLQTKVTEDLLRQEAVQILVDATGREFSVPQQNDPALPSVRSPKQALDEKDQLGACVAIITCGNGCAFTCRPVHHPLPDDLIGTQTNESYACAAGFAAADLAEELADCGKKVEILTERRSFVSGMGFTNRSYLLKRLFSKGVSISNAVQVKKLVPGGLLCEKEDISFFVAADTVVVSQYLQADSSVAQLAKTVGVAYYQVGDRHKVGNALEAFRDAYALSEKITDDCSASQ